MEDWERHFAAKSRRRFDKQQLRRRRRMVRGLIGVAIGGGILAGTIVGLDLLK